MRNDELNNGSGTETGCRLCGKRLPARNNQVSFACRREGLCRECYDNAYLVCKECGDDVPKGRGLESSAARLMGLCRYCYNMRFHQLKHGKVRQELNSAQIRERHLRIHREPAKRLYQPAFYKEWLEFWKTWWRGYTPD